MRMKIDPTALRLAREQFCLDCNMAPETYKCDPGKGIYLRRAPKENGDSQKEGSQELIRYRESGARVQEGSDPFFRAIICMGQLFLMADERIYDWAAQEYGGCKPEWFCKYENLRLLDEKLSEYGREIADTHVYFLPGVSEEWETEDFYNSSMKPVWYEREELEHFRDNNRFGAALAFSKTQPDVLAVAVRKADLAEEKKAVYQTVSKSFCQEQMAGMAGVSRDGARLWQIGINVDPAYKGRGLGVYLVRQLKQEVLRRGVIPFYGTSESHILSQRVGLKSGFVPAWTEVYVRKVK